MSDEYTLVGFFNMFNIIPNFVYPVFKSNDKLYFQDGTKDSIERFVPIKDDALTNVRLFSDIENLICEHSSITVGINSSPIDAFQTDTHTIVCGSTSYMCSFLSSYNTSNQLLESEIKELLEENILNNYNYSVIPWHATGRRKKSVARVWLYPGTGKITINKRHLNEYFGYNAQNIVCQPLLLTETMNKFDIVCNVQGGGFSGQAGAICHGISRALLSVDEANFKSPLKSAGLLTRDPRMKERKKYGLKAARKAPQFSKR